MAGKQRISYVPPDKMTPEMRAEMERCAREGTPRPESSAVRAHVPGAFWSFANSWRDIFHTGIAAPLGYGMLGDAYGVETSIAVIGVAVFLTVPLALLMKPRRQRLYNAVDTRN